MAFDVKINFVGLLHFVQNTSPNSAFRLGIVLPDFPEHSGELLSGTAIFVPHGGGAPQKSISISDHRVFLRFTRSSGDAEFYYSENRITEDPKGLITFEAIAGSFGPQTGDVVKIQPTGPVEAQVFLQEGKFGISTKPSDIYKWDLPSGLTSKSESSISTKFFADVKAVDSLQIVMVPIKGGARPRLFKVTADANVEINLAHTCRFVSTQPVPKWPFLFPDKDFLAHYQLLDPATQRNIIRRVGSLEKAPVPERMVNPSDDKDKRSDPLGGCNCLGTASVGQFFEMDGHFASALRRATDS